MQAIQHILSESRTRCAITGLSQKRLFETVATIISEDAPALSTDAVYSALLAREKLGSTALGNGIAIPHCRLAGCDTAVGALITLAESIDFDAVDQQAVDLIFVLLVPEEANDEHLKILAGLARLLSQPEFCEGLRNADSDAQLYRAAVEYEGE